MVPDVKVKYSVREELTASGIEPTEEMVNKIAEMRVKEEINRGVQMIQYQVITLMTTNGQAPFVTVFMYLDEVPEGQLRDDLAAVIEEVLHQRIQGVKNEKGVFITPAFPKLIYVLEEDNIREGNTLSAILGTCNLCDRLCCNIACSRKALWTVDHRLTDHCAVLEHVL